MVSCASLVIYSDDRETFRNIKANTLHTAYKHRKQHQDKLFVGLANKHIAFVINMNHITPHYF